MINNSRGNIKPKRSLRDLIDKIEWISINAGAHVARGSGIQANEVAIAHFKSKKGLQHADSLRVRFGDNIIKQMEWVIGAKIIPMYDQDDPYYFMLCEAPNGYKLMPENKGRSANLSFKLREKLDFAVQSYKVEYEIYNKYIAFTLRNETN